MFNAQQLRKGDYCLALDEFGETRSAEVIHKGKAFPAVIGVRFSNGDERWFGSKTGTGDILAGARKVEGDWKAL